MDLLSNTDIFSNDNVIKILNNLLFAVSGTQFEMYIYLNINDFIDNND